MSLRIGSLFTGTGALDLAVMDVYDAEVVWHSQYEPPDKKGREDKNQYAAKILARHWPDVPNLGDITKVDWQAVIDGYGPVDVLTGGFPCQDVSSAGRRAGMTPDSRSGLWTHMAHAVSILRPKLVVIENVEGLLSAPAASDLESCTWCVGDGHAEPVLRACGAVLGDLAALGFDAEWDRFGADEVGAPHRRRRIIIRAWPAALHAGGFGRGDGPGFVGGLGSAGRDAEVAAGAADVGHERDRAARDGWPGPADGDLSASDTSGQGRQGGGIRGRSSVHGGSPVADADGIESERRGVAGVLGGQAAAELGEGDQRERARDAARDSRETPADAQGVGRDEGRPEPAGQQGRSDAAERGGATPTEATCPTCGCEESFHDAGGFCAGCHGCTDAELGRPDETPADTDHRRAGEEHQGADVVVGERPSRRRGTVQLAGADRGGDAGHGRAAEESAAHRGTAARQPGHCREAAADADGGRRERHAERDGGPETGQPERQRGLDPVGRDLQRATVLDLRPGTPDLEWGPYEPAIRRWEAVLGRRAPWPTDALGRLSPVFTEWLMGLPDGWVTDTPGLTRPAMLRALGNGVVRQQAAHALRLLHARAIEDGMEAAA